MASPQLENGFTRIANETLEALAKIRISGTEWKIVLVIWRYTYGYHKKTCKLRNMDFANLTNLKRSHVSTAISGLLRKNIIVTEKRNKYGFNKNHKEWSPLKKKGGKTGDFQDRKSIDKVKNRIREIDGNICQLCSRNGELIDEQLDVHHIDLDQSNNSDENLITLCRS